uniref:Uncharacterized protein n=1 Tax=Arundo donax TaxID=35708 RepID=A0A0A9HWG7_ARUDO
MVVQDILRGNGRQTTNLNNDRLGRSNAISNSTGISTSKS